MIIEMEVKDLVPPELLAALSEQVIYGVVNDIAEAARDKWIQLAGQTLQTSRNDYIHSIQPVMFREGVAVITLLGQPANLIENGMPETDLHDTLLGPNVDVAPLGGRGKHPRKGGGYYRAIPFRHGTPGTGGSVGTPMGDPYVGVVKDARELGKKVYGEAKKLPASVSSKGRTAYGGRLPAGIAPKLKKHHATDIYAGMVKMRKTYQSATQSQYMTFRTISTGSPGWIRPATDGKKLSTQVQEFVTRIAPQSFEAYVKSLGT